jgi:hypothetical protein
MKVLTRSTNHTHQLPNTQVYQLLNNQLTIFLRAWGSSEYNQKVIDEVTHYLSTTQADIEVTTPFDYLESLSSLANRTRVALLLAHDLLYKTDNRNEYLVGFECLVLFKNKKEIAWSSVGRFALSKIHNERLNTIFSMGTDLDEDTLLPVQLMGLEKEITVVSGSLMAADDSKLLVASTFNSDLKLSDGIGVTSIEISPYNATYWFSLVNAGG